MAPSNENLLQAWQHAAEVGHAVLKLCAITAYETLSGLWAAPGGLLETHRSLLTATQTVAKACEEPVPDWPGKRRTQTVYARRALKAMNTACCAADLAYLSAQRAVEATDDAKVAAAKQVRILLCQVTKEVSIALLSMHESIALWT